MVWTEQLSVGNEILDSDHKKLLRLADAVDCAAKAGDCVAVSRELKRLRGDMERHFLNEELFSLALDIPFNEHHIDHQNILAEIDVMRGEAGKNIEENIFKIEHFTQLFHNWLIKHVNENDLLMKPMLQTRHYGFKVEGVDN